MDALGVLPFVVKVNAVNLHQPVPLGLAVIIQYNFL